MRGLAKRCQADDEQNDQRSPSAKHRYRLHDWNDPTRHNRLGARETCKWPDHVSGEAQTTRFKQFPLLFFFFRPARYQDLQVPIKACPPRVRLLDRKKKMLVENGGLSRIYCFRSEDHASRPNCHLHAKDGVRLLGWGEDNALFSPPSCTVVQKVQITRCIFLLRTAVQVRESEHGKTAGGSKKQELQSSKPTSSSLSSHGLGDSPPRL